MRKFLGFCAIGAVAAFMAAPASADMWNIDFDNGTDELGNGITFSANTIFSNRKKSYDSDLENDNWQRYDGKSDGNTNPGNPGDSGVPAPADNVTFSIDVWNGAYGKSGFAVGYNSDGTGGRDADLEAGTGGFNTGGVQGVADRGYGNILIIQSHEDSDTRSCGGGLNGNGICTEADDQAGHYGNAGDIIFDFDKEVTLFKMNIFDIEEENKSKVKFYDKDEEGEYVLVDWMYLPVVGDNGVGLLTFGEDGVKADRMMVWLAGSGGIDEIMGESETTTNIPEPGTMALFGVGLAAMGFYRRRRLQGQSPNV